MRSFTILLSSAAMISALCVSAAADPAATAPATPAATATQPAASATDPNKMVCRTMAAKTGSRIGATRQCRTQQEWDDIMAQDQREIQKMQANGNLSPQGH